MENIDKSTTGYKGAGPGFQEPIGQESTKHESTVNIKKEAGNLKEETRRKGREYMAHSKSAAADVVGDFADALQSAAGELDNKNKHTSADYIRLASRSIRQISDSIRKRDIDSLMEQAKTFSRQQPGLFLGGAALTGFALTRLFKSASSEPESDTEVKMETEVEETFPPYAEQSRMPDDIETSSGKFKTP